MYDFGVMRRWLAIVFFVFLTPTSSFAADAFTHAGVTVNYEQGTIDPKTLTGDASNVRITFLSGEKLMIDNYAVSIRSSGQKTYIDDINLSGITAVDNVATWSIENIRISDFILATPNFDFNTLMDGRLLGTIPLSYGAVAIKGLDISNDHGGFKVDQFTLSSQNVDGANFLLNPLQNVQANIKNFRFFPGEANKAAFIEILGVDELSGDVFTTSEYDAKSDRVDGDLNIIMRFNHLGKIELNAGLGLFNAGLKMLDENFDATGKYEEDKALKVLIFYSLVNSGSIAFTDYGIIDQLIGMAAKHEGVSRDDLIDTIMADIADVTAEIAPEAYAKIFESILIRNFLQQGGDLTMTMAPSSPIPFTALATYITLLNDDEGSDFAATSLGLNITHQPQ